MTTKDYARDGITVHWDSEKCIHSGHCARSLPKVFKPKERPWVTPEEATVAELAESIDGCPSGALSYTRTDEASQHAGQDAHSGPVAAERQTPRTTIRIGVDGPYEVVGEVELLNSEGKTVRESRRLFLCRCGHSDSKPYCDGSHSKHGFRDAGQPEK